MQQLHDLSRSLASFLLLVAAAALSGCVDSPDLDCSPWDEGLNCEPGYKCDTDYKCHPIRKNSANCDVVSACLDGLCRPYVQACAEGEPCAEGFQCNGSECVKIIGNCHPEVADICHQQAACTATDSGPRYYCACNDGWAGDGFLCEDIDECSEGTHDCQDTAACVNSLGGFSCVCELGYEPTADGKGCISGWLQASLGELHSCGVRHDGSLFCWGDNSHGQLGNGMLRGSNLPSVAGDPLQTWLAVAAGARHTCGIASDKTLHCWGNNSHGQLGSTEPSLSTWPQPVLAPSTFQVVAAGAGHTCAVASDNALWCWGDNSHGQLGTSASGPGPHQVDSSPPQEWQSVIAGPEHTCALTTGSELFCWGRGDSGQVGNGSLDDQHVPAAIGTDWWQSLSLGAHHTCGVQLGGTLGGSLWCWGDNSSGQLDGAAGTSSMTPRQIESSGWLRVASGTRHNCGTKTDGGIYCWGSNAAGQAGTRDTSPVSAIGPVLDKNFNWAVPLAGGHRSCGVRDDDSLWCWGARDHGQIGDGQGGALPTPVLQRGSTQDAWQSIAAGNSHGCGIDDSRNLWCWGANDQGQLGNDASTQHQAQRVSSTTDWAEVDSGGGHSCALDISGGLWCWGENSSGQIGTTPQPSNQPARVGKDEDWQAVSAGGAHTCALKGTSGASDLWCWGNNDAGQLGLGAAAIGAPALAPAPVGTGDPWIAVSSGELHTCALKGTSGASDLWCWGNNDAGQLGLDPGEPAQPEPRQVGSDTDWIAVSAGATLTCGLRHPGTLYCWGTWGRAGEPAGATQIGDASDWLAISAGGSLQRDQSFACGLRQDTAWCWGSGGSGQLGNASFLDRGEPVQVLGTGFTRLVTGGAFACGIASGRALCWGSDDHGQRGDGTSWLPLPVLEP